MVNPGFFKFYQPSLGEEINRKIPRFSEPVQGSWPTTLTLRDRYSNSWSVKVELVGDAWHFSEGWEKFIVDNMVEEGDVIAYEYSYRGLLDFKVFDGSACMTKGVGCRIKVEDAVAQDVSQDRTQKKGRRVGSTPAVNGGASTSKPRKEIGNPRSDYDWFGTKIMSSGQISQPANPYFVTKIRKDRASELYVPTVIIKGYRLELPDTILLVDPEGREFRVKRKAWKDGRALYSEGWKDLCEMNMVGNEDFCICEFVRRGEDQVIHVSFFRPNEHQ